MATILSARDVPIGGDTMWSNQYLAYETLSEGMKALLDGVRAEFTGARLAKLASSEGEVPRSFHPVVRTHPETGRKSLYIGSHTQRFAGMTDAESEPLLDYLQAYSVRPEFTCRFRWEPGSMALWDNRCTQHFAVDDYDGQRRRMHRITIAGDEPF